MKRLLILALLLGCSQPQPVAPDTPRLTPGVTLKDITFHSNALNRDMHYRVILPTNTPNRLPAIYLLHGINSRFTDWTNNSNVASFATHGYILIMPQGDDSYYTNSATVPADRYEDYIATDLIRDAESRFPIINNRASRAVIGVSMGGFGALNLAFKHPDLFHFVAALSPAIDVTRRRFSLKRMAQTRHFAAIFGGDETPSRRANDPFLLAAHANPATLPTFYITCGDREPLLAPNRDFTTSLTNHHIPFTFTEVHGGHDWSNWNAQLPASSPRSNISHVRNAKVIVQQSMFRRLLSLPEKLV